MTRLPYNEAGLAKPSHIDPVLINAMMKETGMIECECGNELAIEMDTTRADGVDRGTCSECGSVYEHRRFSWHT